METRDENRPVIEFDVQQTQAYVFELELRMMTQRLNAMRKELFDNAKFHDEKAEGPGQRDCYVSQFRMHRVVCEELRNVLLADDERA